jgi:hypothetical protein
METLFAHMGYELIETQPGQDGKRTYLLRDLNRKSIVILSPEALAQLAEDLNTFLQAKDTEAELPV